MKVYLNIHASVLNKFSVEGKSNGITKAMILYFIYQYSQNAYWSGILKNDPNANKEESLLEFRTQMVKEEKYEEQTFFINVTHEQIAQELNISRMTVQKYLIELENEKFIYSKKMPEVFANRKQYRICFLNFLTSFSENITRKKG